MRPICQAGGGRGAHLSAARGDQGLVVVGMPRRRGGCWHLCTELATYAPGATYAQGAFLVLSALKLFHMQLRKMREQRRKLQDGHQEAEHPGVNWMGGGEWVSAGELAEGQSLDDALAVAGMATGEWCWRDGGDGERMEIVLQNDSCAASDAACLLAACTLPFVLTTPQEATPRCPQRCGMLTMGRSCGGSCCGG